MSIVPSLLLSILTITLTASAGSTVVTLKPKELRERALYLEKGEKRDLSVSGGDKTIDVACGFADADGDMLKTDGGNGCLVWGFTAPYSGKYKVLVLNRSDEEIKAWSR